MVIGCESRQNAVIQRKSFIEVGIGEAVMAWLKLNRGFILDSSP